MEGVVEAGEAEAGMTTGTVEAAAMTIVTEALEAGAVTVATHGRGGPPETIGAALAPGTGGERGAGVRLEEAEEAGTVVGAAARTRAGPGAGAKCPSDAREHHKINKYSMLSVDHFITDPNLIYPIILTENKHYKFVITSLIKSSTALG